MPLDRFGVSRPWYVAFPRLVEAIGLLVASLLAGIQLLTSRHRLPDWWRFTVVVVGVVMVVAASISLVWHVRQRIRINREVEDEAAHGA